jgi:hypothetical protein
VARLFSDQRERQQPEVALRQHAPGAHHVAVTHAMPSAAEAVAVTPAAMPPAGPAFLESSSMSHSKHLRFSFN